MSEPDAKKSVLVVDDTPSNIQTVNSILKDCYKVRIGTSGSKALELVKVAPTPDGIPETTNPFDVEFGARAFGNFSLQSDVPRPISWGIGFSVSCRSGQLAARRKICTPTLRWSQPTRLGVSAVAPDCEAITAE